MFYLHKVFLYLLVLILGAEIETVFEAEEFTHCLLVWDIHLQQTDEELVMTRLTLETLKDNIKDTVGVEIEVPDD